MAKMNDVYGIHPKFWNGCVDCWIPKNKDIFKISYSYLVSECRIIFKNKCLWQLTLTWCNHSSTLKVDAKSPFRQQKRLNDENKEKSKKKCRVQW